MTTTDQKQLLLNIVGEYIKNSNWNRQNTNAKNFMNRTGISYQDIYTDMGVDEDSADHYVILTEHFIPSLTDGEVETTLDNIHGGWFESNGYYDDSNYDALVDDMISQG